MAEQTTKKVKYIGGVGMNRTVPLPDSRMTEFIHGKVVELTYRDYRELRRGKGSFKVQFEDVPDDVPADLSYVPEKVEEARAIIDDFVVTLDSVAKEAQGDIKSKALNQEAKKGSTADKGD